MTIKDRVLEKAKQYKPAAGESIVRNRHMNRYRGEVPNQKITDEIVDSLVAALTSNEQPLGNLGAFATEMVSMTENWWKSEHGLAHDRDLLAAVAVDFLNFACVPLDLGLYTIDIDKP